MSNLEQEHKICIADILQRYLFEVNSKQTRKHIVYAIKQYLHSIESENCIVICDERNNESFDSNKLNIDIVFEDETYKFSIG